MGSQLQTHVAFHLTGKRMGQGLEAADPDLRPALCARFADLTQVRYDFPLVLCAVHADEAAIVSVTAVVNGILQAIAPRGIEGEAIRRHVLRLEREIRTLAAQGTTGALSRLWDSAAERIGAAKDAALAADLKRARAALKLDGEVVDCTHGLPAQLVSHAWHAVQQVKADRFDRQLNRLAVKLADILHADFARSALGTSAERLKASVGTGMESQFDFDAFSSTLAAVAGKHTLTESRRQRVQRVVAVLKAHASAPRTNAAWPDDLKTCVFSNCRDALASFRARLEDIVDLVKAMAIAELEIEGRYDEATHDAFFAEFDEAAVSARDLALFPDYLVCIDSEALQAPENAGLTEILASEMPIKVVVQVSDVLEEPALRAHRGFLSPAAQLGKMAMGLGNVYVLQTTASHLYRSRGSLVAGLGHSGPALFNVFSGSASRGTLSPYLLAAAALQSRAFPTFAYDPNGGSDWSTRLSLAGNPLPDADWTVHDFDYEDEAHQSLKEQVAFTYVDFVACDPRHGRHFAIVPRRDWDANMTPVAAWLGDGAAPAEKVPYVTLVDGECEVQRALVEESVIAAAQRCREMWHALQEMAGVRNPQAERLLARERKAWEEDKQREIEALKREAKASVATATAAGASSPPAASGAPAVAASSPAAAPRAPAAQAEPEKASDDPYIETPRCTTCNECTNLNNRMFAYDGNKQAYIADIAAGSYRELVEAAENCQVSIIHPGKPRDPNEPGVAELMKRAEAFA